MHELITDQPETGQHHCQAALGRIASLIPTAVFKLKGLATGRPSANLFEGIADILIGIASESASLRPADKNVTQRRTIPKNLREAETFAPTEMAKPYWRIGVGAVSKHGDGHVSGLTLPAILLFCRQQTVATQKGIHVRPARRSSLQIGSRTRARRKLTTASSASRHSVGLRSHLRHPAALVAEKLDGATAEAVGAPMTSEK